MSEFSFVLPADFADYEWQAEAKGWFSEATLIVSGKRYRLNFYDPARLSQEIEDELERDGWFFEPNLVLVKSVTRSHMQRAAEQPAKSVSAEFACGGIGYAGWVGPAGPDLTNCVKTLLP